jgi:molecular chaperone DnaK (HSP70)
MAFTNEDKAWLEEQFQGLRTELQARMEQSEKKLRDNIERVETNLLTEFHKWASPNEARQRTHHLAIRDLDMQLEALEERVRKLEERRQ